MKNNTLKRLGMITILSALAVTTWGCRQQDPQDSTIIAEPDSAVIAEPDSTGTTQPAATSEEPSMSNFTSQDLDGNQVDETLFADYKLTMINVWATYCSPCLQEMPDLASISTEYKDKGVQIIGIISDAYDNTGTISEDKNSLIQEILVQTGANYPQILPSNDLIYAQLQYMQVVPTTIFVDADGQIVGDTIKGSRPKAEWEAIIDEHLALVAEE